MPRTLVLATLAIAVALGGAPVEPSEIERQVEALVQPLEKARDFAGTILIARGADTLFLRSYGEADVALGVPNRTDTPMRTGSIAKQFTAAAILLLEEDGALSVDNELSRFLPSFPRANEITIHLLLTHQSGVTRDVFSEWQERRAPRSLATLVEEIARQPLDFEPGSRTSYSNAGYTLLAYIVETVSGLPFAEFLETRVFGPVEMHQSGVWRPDDIVTGMATGYDPGPAPDLLIRTPYEDPSNILGAGAIYSTVGDLHRWSEALESDVLLSVASREKMLTPYGAGRGYGIGVGLHGAAKRVGHDGVTHGFIAFLDRDLSDDLTIAYTGNIRTGVLEDVRTALGAIVRGDPWTPIEPATPAGPVDSDASRFEGVYELFPGFHIEVSRDGDDLYLLGTGGYPTVLVPIGERTYFYRARYETIRFEEDEDGVTGLTWIDRAGETYPAERVSAARVPAQPAP